MLAYQRLSESDSLLHVPMQSTKSSPEGPRLSGPILLLKPSRQMHQVHHWKQALKLSAAPPQEVINVQAACKADTFLCAPA